MESPHQSSNAKKGSNVCYERYGFNAKSINMVLTKKTTTLPVIAITSAQETTSGQNCSTVSLTTSIISNPTRLKFGNAVFSVFGPSNKTDASHPYSKGKEHI